MFPGQYSTYRLRMDVPRIPVKETDPPLLQLPQPPDSCQGVHCDLHHHGNTVEQSPTGHRHDMFDPCRELCDQEERPYSRRSEGRPGKSPSPSPSRTSPRRHSPVPYSPKRQHRSRHQSGRSVTSEDISDVSTRLRCPSPSCDDDGSSSLSLTSSLLEDMVDVSHGGPMSLTPTSPDGPVTLSHATDLTLAISLLCSPGTDARYLSQILPVSLSGSQLISGFGDDDGGVGGGEGDDGAGGGGHDWPDYNLSSDDENLFQDELLMFGDDGINGPAQDVEPQTGGHEDVHACPICETQSVCGENHMEGLHDYTEGLGFMGKCSTFCCKTEVGKEKLYSGIASAAPSSECLDEECHVHSLYGISGAPDLESRYGCHSNEITTDDAISEDAMTSETITCQSSSFPLISAVSEDSDFNMTSLFQLNDVKTKCHSDFTEMTSLSPLSDAESTSQAACDVAVFTVESDKVMTMSSPPDCRVSGFTESYIPPSHDSLSYKPAFAQDPNSRPSAEYEFWHPDKPQTTAPVSRTDDSRMSEWKVCDPDTEEWASEESTDLTILQHFSNEYHSSSCFLPLDLTPSPVEDVDVKLKRVNQSGSSSPPVLPLLPHRQSGEACFSAMEAPAGETLVCQDLIKTPEDFLPRLVGRPPLHLHQQSGEACSSAMEAPTGGNPVCQDVIKSTPEDFALPCLLGRPPLHLHHGMNVRLVHHALPSPYHPHLPTPPIVLTSHKSYDTHCHHHPHPHLNAPPTYNDTITHDYHNQHQHHHHHHHHENLDDVMIVEGPWRPSDGDIMTVNQSDDLDEQGRGGEMRRGVLVRGDLTRTEEPGHGRGGELGRGKDMGYGEEREKVRRRRDLGRVELKHGKQLSHGDELMSGEMMTREQARGDHPTRDSDGQGHDISRCRSCPDLLHRRAMTGFHQGPHLWCPTFDLCQPDPHCHTDHPHSHHHTHHHPHSDSDAPHPHPHTHHHPHSDTHALHPRHHAHHQPHSDTDDPHHTHNQHHGGPYRGVEHSETWGLEQPCDASHLSYTTTGTGGIPATPSASRSVVIGRLRRVLERRLGGLSRSLDTLTSAVHEG